MFLRRAMEDDKVENVLNISTMTSQSIPARIARVEIRPATQTSITLTLPPVSEYAGRILTIILISLSTANVITVVDAGDAITAISDNSMDAAEDKYIFYCDGLAWYSLADYTA